VPGIWHTKLIVSGNGNIHQWTGYYTQPRVAIITKTHQLCLTISPTIPTNLPFEGPSITPSNTYHQHLDLPIPPQPSEMHPTLSTAVVKSLVEQLHSNLELWQRPLFGPIWKLQPTSHLLQLCRNQDPILTVSDTSVQEPNRVASHGWSHTTTSP